MVRPINRRTRGRQTALYFLTVFLPLFAAFTFIYARTAAVSASEPDSLVFQVSVVAQEGGTVAEGSSGLYAQGEVIMLSASADEGYVFTGWIAYAGDYASVGDLFEDAENETTSFTVPGCDVTIMACFDYDGYVKERIRPVIPYFDMLPFFWGFQEEAPSMSHVYVMPAYAGVDRNNITDLVVELTPPGNYELRALKYESYTLKRNFDYIQNGNEITILANYIFRQALGEQVIEFDIGGKETNPLLILEVGVSQPLHVPMLLAEEFPEVSVIEDEIFYIELSMAINQRRTSFAGQPPILLNNGTSLIPVRETFEKLGYTCEWDPNNRSAALKKKNVTVYVVDGGYFFVTNGQRYGLDYPVRIINGSLMMPFADVMKSIGVRAARDANDTIGVFFTP